MPNKVLLLLLCLSISVTSFSQYAYYRKGFVVTLQGDTLSGYIERLNDVALGKKVNFKENGNDKPIITFHPADLRCFYVEEENIQFEPVPVSISLANDSAIVTEERFGVLILSGYCNLYNVALDETEKPAIFEPSNHIYIAKKGNTYIQLSETEKLDGSEYTLTKDYVDSMEVIFSDCNSINENLIASALFSNSSMIRLFTMYNNCMKPGTPILVHNAESPVQIKHGLEASYLTYSTKGIITTPTAIPSYIGIPVAFSFGYFINLLKPSVSESNSATIDLNYLQLNYKVTDSLGTVKSYSNGIIRMSLLTNYNFADSKANLIPFVGIGATAFYNINQSPYFSVEFPVAAGCFLGKKFIATVLYGNFLYFFQKGNKDIFDFRIGYRLK